MCLEFEIFYGLNSNFCRLIIWEMKLTRRNTAEYNTLYPVLLRQLQAGAIARRKYIFIALCNLFPNNRTDCVNYIPAGQIKCRGNFCFTRFFFASLLSHQFCTSQTKLHTCKSVNGIVNAAVIRVKTAEHLAVRRIYNSAARQRSNIPLPKIQSLLDRL